MSIKELSQQVPKDIPLFLIDQNWITSRFLSKSLAREMVSLGSSWEAILIANEVSLTFPTCTEEAEDTQSELDQQERGEMLQISLDNNYIGYTDLNFEQETHGYNCF